MQSITFENVKGMWVPSSPWPQELYISGTMWHANIDAYVVRPLTVTGLIKGVGRNFITMNYWRFLITLRILGLLNTPEIEILRWRHFTLHVRKNQMWHRLRVVKAYRRVSARLRG